MCVFIRMTKWCIPRYILSYSSMSLIRLYHYKAEYAMFIRVKEDSQNVVDHHMR